MTSRLKLEFRTDRHERPTIVFEDWGGIVCSLYLHHRGGKTLLAFDDDAFTAFAGPELAALLPIFDHFTRTGALMTEAEYATLTKATDA